MMADLLRARTSGAGGGEGLTQDSNSPRGEAPSGRALAVVAAEAARLMQELGDAVPTPIFFRDADGIMVYCNKALAQLLGLKAEDIMGRRPADFLPSELAQEMEESGRLLYATGQAQVEERVLPTAHGPLEVQIHRRLLLDNHGQAAGLVGSVLDLSLQHKAMEAVRAGEARYRGLFELSLDGILVLDGDRILEANPAASQLFGRPVGELAGMRLSELSPTFQPDGRFSRDKLLMRLDAAGAGRRQFFEWVHMRRDGGAFDAELTLAPMELDRERVLLAMVRDITDRKQAEAALRASEEFNRGMIQNAPIGVMYVDLDGVLIYENPAMERMMGVPRGGLSRMLGRSLADLPGLSRVPVHEVLGRVAQGEIVRNMEVEYHSLYDTISQLLVQVAPHWDAGGRVIGAVFLVQDVTELRKLELQLRQAQKMDAIGSLAGGMAHDFNNLLTGVTGNAELALQHLDDPAQVRQFLERQLDITQHAAELTKRLLTFSRQQESVARPLLLSRLLDEQDMVMRRLVGDAVQLEVRREPGLWAIRADSGQIEQVVVNLVVNARDAMPDGGRLSLNLRNVELDANRARRELGLEPGPYVELEVSDTGCGIDESVRSRIFEPFFTTKEMGKGTGLGLAIVYAIVKKCGGGILVDSQSGQGSRFSLYFPSIGVQAPVSDGEAREARSLAEGSERILVIEDEPAVRELSVRLLEHCGYTVYSAADGPSAIALAQSGMEAVDLVFSDVIMPGMSGPVAVQRLMEIWPGLRVLFCSGYTDGELNRHGLHMEMGALLLPKPFTLQKLSHAVRQALEEHAN